MEYTHIKVLREFTGMSGYTYKKGEVYEILRKKSAGVYTIRNKANELVDMCVDFGTDFNGSLLLFSPYCDNLKTILE